MVLDCAIATQCYNQIVNSLLGMIINYHDYCITFWKITTVFPVIIDLKCMCSTSLYLAQSHPKILQIKKYNL